MPKYKVTNIYKYTAEVIVDAKDKQEALDKALGMEDEAQGDDWLYDSKVKLVKE